MNRQELRITHFIAYETYGGCLEGIPSKESRVRLAMGTAEESWGVRPTLVRMPDGHGGRETLPPWTMIAWLDGPALDPEDHGNQLVLIWFAFSGPVTGIEIGTEEWEKNSKGYQI